MQHPRRSKYNHRPWVVSESPIKGLDVLELEHVPLHESLADLLVGPGDEQLVVVVGLLGQPRGEVDGHLQVHALPEGLQEDAELLGAAQRKHGDQHLPTTLHGLVDFLQEVSLPAALRVADGRGVRGLRDEQVGAALVNPGSSQVSVWGHVIITRVDHRL